MAINKPRAAVKHSKNPAVPEPSLRAVMGIVAAALALVIAIIVFDYATGDPRASWVDAHSTLKKIDFKRSG